MQAGGRRRKKEPCGRTPFAHRRQPPHSPPPPERRPLRACKARRGARGVMWRGGVVGCWLFVVVLAFVDAPFLLMRRAGAAPRDWRGAMRTVRFSRGDFPGIAPFCALGIRVAPRSTRGQFEYFVRLAVCVDVPVFSAHHFPAV